MCFNIFRWSVAILLGIIYSLLLTLTVIIITFVITFSDSDNMKEWLAETTLYEKSFDIGVGLIGMNLEVDGEDSENTLLYKISDPTSSVHQALYDLATPQFIESSVNKVIDGFYDWMKGETATPIFVIELTTDEDELERIITLAFRERAVGLPVCHNMYDPAEEFNPISDECRPSNYNVNNVEKYIEEISETEEYKEFKENFKIDSEKIIVVTEDQTEQVQLGYKIFRYSPIIMSLLSLMFGLFYSAMIPGKVKGFISMGTVAIFVGGIMALFSYFSEIALGYIYSDFIWNYIPSQSAEVKELAEELAINMVKGFSSTLMIVSLVVMGLGVLIAIGAYVLDKYKDRRERKITPY